MEGIRFRKREGGTNFWFSFVSWHLKRIFAHKDRNYLLDALQVNYYRSIVKVLFLLGLKSNLLLKKWKNSLSLFRNISVLNTLFALSDLHGLTCYRCCFCLKNRSILFILEKYRNITRLCCGEEHGLLWKCCMSEKALRGKNGYCVLSFSWIIISSPPSSHVVEFTP